METDFDSVWRRVNGNASPEAPETQLRRFLLSETEDICLLRKMLRQTCDAFLCRQLSQICTEKSRQLKRLRTALSLIAGDCECTAVDPKDPPPELLPALKHLYERVCSAAAAYRKAAAETDRPALETVYASLYEAELRHAGCLTDCVERMLFLSGSKAPL